MVEKKVTPVAGAETFCTSTFGSKKPTIMTGAIQLSAAIAPSAKTPPDIALDNVHPTLAQQFNAWSESGESTSLYQHPQHFEYVQSIVYKLYVKQIALTIYSLSDGEPLYGTANKPNPSIEDWLGMGSTNDLLSKDPLDLLYGDFWSSFTGGAQESFV